MPTLYGPAMLRSASLFARAATFSSGGFNGFIGVLRFSVHHSPHPLLARLLGCWSAHTQLNPQSVAAENLAESPGKVILHCPPRIARPLTIPQRVQSLRESEHPRSTYPWSAHGGWGFPQSRPASLDCPYSRTPQKVPPSTWSAHPPTPLPSITQKEMTPSSPGAPPSKNPSQFIPMHTPTEPRNCSGNLSPAMAT